MIDSICKQRAGNAYKLRIFRLLSIRKNEFFMSDKEWVGVYQKNVRAVRFYLRENFLIQAEEIDEDTGEKEYIMRWGK